MTKTLKLSDIYVKKNDTVTQSSNGLMLYQDKIKLDSLEDTIASAISNIDFLTEDEVSATYLSKSDANTTYVKKESGLGLFSGSYNDLSDKPTIPTVPSASSTTPSADTTNGSVGDETTWAKADHTHPKSTIYAESEHTHDDRYYTETEIQNNYVAKDGSKVLSDNNFSDTYKSALDNLSSDYIKKSDTPGLIKNDGNVDTNTYLTSHQDISGKSDTTHTHGNITKDGEIGTTSGKPLITTTGGKITTGAFGTSSGQFAEGNHTHTKSEITDFPITEMDTATLNTSNLYASTSFVNFIRIGNKVMATGVLNTVSLANTNQEYNVFNGFDYTKPSSDITVKTANTRNNSDFTFQIKTNGSGYVTPKTANTSGTLHFNVVYSVQSTGGGGYVIPKD